MPGLFSPDVDYAGKEMLRVACALYANGFADDWRYQFSAMIDVVNTATGQTSRIDGLSTRISSSTVSKWNCENVYSMNPKLAVDDYILDPVMTK